MSSLRQWKSPELRDPDVFDIRIFTVTLWHAIRHHKALVVAVTIALLVLVQAYVMIWPPIYQVEARIAAERELDPSRDTFYSNWQTFRKFDGRDEIGFITSGDVLNDVVRKLNLKYDDVYHPFMSHASYLWEKSWPGRTYKQLKRQLLPDPDDQPTDNMELGRILGDLRAGINVTQEQDMHIATVTVKAPSRRASEIANTLLDSYLERRAQWNSEEAKKAYDALSQQMTTAWAELVLIRDRRMKFNQSNGLYLQFQKDTQDLKELTDVETDLANQRTKISALEASQREVQLQLAKEPETRTVSTVQEASSVRDNLRTKRLDLETTLAQVKNRYKSDSPEVREIEQDLAEIKKLLAAEPAQIERSRTDGISALHQHLRTSDTQLGSDVAGARAAFSRLEERAASLRQRVNRLPGLSAMATDYDREYGLAGEKYQQIMLRRLQAEVSMVTAKSGPSSVRILDRAMPPSSKYWPRMKLLYPAALLTGMLLGAVAAYFRTLFSGRLLSVHLETNGISLPLYARIPIPAGGPKTLLTVSRAYDHQREKQ